MAKSSLLIRADTSGDGSRRLLMVARNSFNSAWKRNDVFTITVPQPTLVCWNAFSALPVWRCHFSTQSCTAVLSGGALRWGRSGEETWWQFHKHPHTTLWARDLQRHKLDIETLRATSTLNISTYGYLIMHKVLLMECIQSIKCFDKSHNAQFWLAVI